MHVHVVQKGDTLWKISKQYGVSFDEVKRLNAHLANPDYIVPGMKIFVPQKSSKMHEVKDHPYNNGRTVKKNKEEYMVPPATKPIPQPVPQPKPYPTMQPIPQPIPQPTPQPIMQMPPQVVQQPINQHLTMTQMMPPYMGIPYGWIPVPDMDAHHPQILPTTQLPQQPPPQVHPPTPTPPPAPTLPQGWQLQDSSSLGDVETSSLQMPILPPQYHKPASPCGPPPPEYYQQQQQFHQEPRPCGCGKPGIAPAAYGQNPYESQENQNMMPQQMMHHQNMMPGQMAPQQMMPGQMTPYMACTPCHMMPAPQGQWGYPTPVRYY